MLTRETNSNKKIVNINGKKVSNKISLIKLTEKRETLIPPYGLLLIATELRKKGFDPSILHIERDEINIPEIVESVSEDLFVGISTLTSNYLTVELEISEAIKREHDNKVKVVWGGHHPSLCPETTLKEDCIDYIVVGEGEEAIVTLAEFLQKGEKQNGDQKHWRNEAGLGYKEGNKNIINPKALLPDLEPHAYAWDLIDVEKYLNPEFGYKRVLSYLSSKGCPYACSFCYNLEFNNRSWRGWSSEKVINDINYLKEKYDVEAIYFYDDYYFTHKKRVTEIAKGIDLPWYAELRANDIKNDVMREYKKLKAFGFFFGAESGSENVLEITVKKIKPTDILDAARICKEEGISHLRCSFIFFVPGESIKDINVTVVLITKLMREYPYVVIGIGNYTPYPGVPLTEKAKDFGWKEPTTTKEWAKYDRSISPYEVGIFPDSYIRKVLKLRENALTTQNFYHFLNEQKIIGNLINITLRPFSKLFDHLLRLNLVSHTFESLLFKILYPLFKLCKRFISFFFNSKPYLRRQTSVSLEQTTPDLKTGSLKRKYFWGDHPPSL